MMDLCKKLEHFETPEWAAKVILKKEVLSPLIVDPCTGAGILARAARAAGYFGVNAFDIHDWGFPCRIQDFLDLQANQPTIHNLDGYALTHDCGWTCFMNPPFSLATQFVEKSFELGAQKIVCFQRFAWWESRDRREFWRKHPPSRVWICGDRAASWRHDIPLDQRKGSSPTAHAWFVWERGAPPGTLLGHIWKDGA